MGKWVVANRVNDIREHTQFVKQEGPHEFRVVEHGTYPEEDDIGPTYVDLEDYSEEDILEYLKPYGYTERQEPFVEAECIAEQTMECELTSRDWNSIEQWEKNVGINLDELDFMNEVTQEKIINHLNTLLTGTVVTEIINYSDMPELDFYHVEVQLIQNVDGQRIYDQNVFTINKEMI